MGSPGCRGEDERDFDQSLRGFLGQGSLEGQELVQPLKLCLSLVRGGGSISSSSSSWRFCTLSAFSLPTPPLSCATSLILESTAVFNFPCNKS